MYAIRSYYAMATIMTTKEFNPEKLAKDYTDKSPQEILGLALENFDNIAISFSGAEDVVLIDIATKIRPDVKVFSLDTGRLHAETYRFIEQVRNHYKISIDVLSPVITSYSIHYTKLYESTSRSITVLSH